MKMTGKILIVDDEPDILRLLEKIIFNQTRCEVVSTNNSLEAPELLEKNDFSVLLLDIRMPGLSGMEILEMIRQEKRLEQAILITAFSSTESAEEAIRLGAVDYIEKPFKKERIISSIENAMKQYIKEKKLREFELMLAENNFSVAAERFKSFYAANLLDENANADIETIAKNSGLPIDYMKSALK